MLHSISFKNLPELTTITCSYNDLTNIDVTQNTKLRILYCYNNANLASIDLKNNSALFSLSCKNTKITTLDLSVCDEDIKSYLSCDANVTVTYPDGTTSVTSEDEFTSEDDE